ncbi:MAG TPA: efflux RND transporter periplasmic adaptor subunit [Longimicrobiaceae bacterium]|nr:efflux RND transporter periplasmic adaptor subunit [Longimicrobiaceae bacterium]
MKRRTKVILAVAALAVTTTAAIAIKSGSSGKENAAESVKVTRGDVVEKALAVGTIEPEVQVSVKSKVGGVVRQMLVQPGTFVRAGAPLMEIRPDPTPVELVDARRQLQLKEIDLANARREMDRQKALTDRDLAPMQALESAKRTLDEAELQVRMAREKLELLQSGSIRGTAGAESMVRSPIDGFVLEKMVETGDPVTPLSTYQEGTVLMRMADMGHLIFRGSVDEIDVGKLHEGMPVEIKIGALPSAHIQGVVRRISLQAKKAENATTFPVEITLTQTSGATLRAGLSANAEIIVRRRDHVLTVPERVVTFNGDTASVEVPGPDATRVRRRIQTGLSDAVTVEVVSGLREGEAVLEKPVKKIE